jgi:hypothetical protein
MDDAAFSEDFIRFLRAAVPTVDAAEVILFLQRERERWWSAEELAAALAPSTILTPAQAAACFAICQANQIIAAGPDKRVQYRPGSAELEAHVDMLAQAYRERPVTLIRVIYALRDTKIRSFADASKLKRN